MFKIIAIFSACFMLGGAVAPLTVEELQHIRDFTAKAHMKRVEAFPDQIMTASTQQSHYLGRRIPAVEKPPPTMFMQAPTNINAVVKPTAYAVQPQASQGVPNILLNFPLAPGSPAPVFQQRPQQYQFIPIQHAPTAASAQNPQIAGQIRPQQFSKRPSFFNFPEASNHQSIFSFFFPRRQARRPQFRPPLRFQFAAAPSTQQQHEQGLQSVMQQQHLLNVQQQSGGQQVQPSSAPITSQSTTIKTSMGLQSVPTVGPSPVPQILQTATLLPVGARLVGNQILLPNNAHQQQGSAPQQAPVHPNQFHREITFFGKPFGKPRPPQKFAFIPQNRPGDGNQYVQKYVGPHHDFSFLPFGPPPPQVLAGPPPSGFRGPPVSFSHIEQIPLAGQPPRVLPVPMIVQSQEFPHYHFATNYNTGNSAGPTVVPYTLNKASASQATPTTQSQDGQIITGTIRPQKVRRVKARVNTPTSTTGAPVTSTTKSLGEVIFESSKETREFHDSARIVPSTSFTVNTNEGKPRKPKQESKAVENSVVVAPLVFTKESSEPIVISSSSPRPPVSSTTVISVSTSGPTEEPYKAKIVKSKGVEFHKSKAIHHHHPNHNHSEKRVTASGAGFGVVTAEPMRASSTSSTRITSSPGGRVVTTSVTSRVVSTGANPQKRYRLRKVKVPNPDAKNKSTTPSVTSSSSSSRSTTSTTTIIPSTTIVSSSYQPRSTTTVLSTSTEGSSTTVA